MEKFPRNTFERWLQWKFWEGLRQELCSMGEVKIEWEVQSKTYERKKLCEGLGEELGWISGHLCYAVSTQYLLLSWLYIALS